MLSRILSHPGSEFGIHFRNASWSSLQSRSFRIFADSLDDQSHALGNSLKIYRRNALLSILAIRLLLWKLGCHTFSAIPQKTLSLSILRYRRKGMATKF